MNLDPRTIIFLIIIGTMLMGGGLMVVARGYLGEIQGASRWAKATLIQSLGWIVVGALRGVLPDVVSIVVGNGLILLSLVWYLFILAEFKNKRIHSSWLYALIIAQTALLTYFATVSPNITARHIVISMSSAAVMLKSLQILLSGRTSRIASHIFTASLFSLCGSFMVARAIYYLASKHDANEAPYGLNTVNDVSYLIFYVLAVMLTYGFVLMCNDRYVSQQKQAEDALQKSHDLFSKLSSQVPGVIYQYQLFPDGRACFPFASQGMQEIYEVSPEDVRADASKIYPYLHPQDADAISASILESARTLAPWQLEYRVLLPKQGLRWRMGHAQPERLPDGSVLWHGFITDITERALAQEKQRQLEQQVRTGYDALKVSEQRLRRLMNSSLIGIIQGDVSGRLKEANDVLLQMAGYERTALSDGALNWFGMLAESGRAQMQQSIKDLLQQNVLAPFESQMIRRDGTPVPIMLGLAQLEGDDDEWVGFVLDLREQRRMDQLKSEFISVVSHELRTPLTSIRGSLGLLESGVVGELPPKALHLIKIAHKNSQRLISLVNDILDMEKLASGTMTVNMQRIDLVALARQAIEANAAYAETFKVRYVLDAHPVQAYVLADANRLMQVFANLLSNAAKFSSTGACVTLRIIHLDHRFRVEVEDQGSGIPASFRDRIFGKFAQADGTDTRQLAGTGLGLNITKTLIEKMQGEIGFETEEGAGTVFWFVLPASTDLN